MHLRVPRKIGDSQRASGTASDTELAILSDDLEETRDGDLLRLNDSTGSPENKEHSKLKIRI